MMCRFYQECEYASSKAFTCSKGGGGDYCGKYRLLAFENADSSTAAVKYERAKELLA